MQDKIRIDKGFLSRGAISINNEGGRIALGAATLEHIQFYLKTLQREGNFATHRRWARNYEMLEPYLSVPGTAFKEALEQYRRDHPTQ